MHQPDHKPLSPLSSMWPQESPFCRLPCRLRDLQLGTVSTHWLTNFFQYPAETPLHPVLTWERLDPVRKDENHQKGHFVCKRQWCCPTTKAQDSKVAGHRAVHRLFLLQKQESVTPLNTNYGWLSVELWILLYYGVYNLLACVHKAKYLMMSTIRWMHLDHMQWQIYPYSMFLKAKIKVSKKSEPSHWTLL